MSTNVTTPVFISRYNPHSQQPEYVYYVYNSAVGLMIVVGTVGFLCSTVVLYIMLTLSSRSKTTNILIINQLVLDTMCCLFIVVTESVGYTIRNHPGPLRLFECYIFQGGFINLSRLAGSITNLVLITLEQYVKIVYSIYHRKYFRKGMVYLAVIIAWVSGVLQNIVVFWTSGVGEGFCYPYWFWPSKLAKVIRPSSVADRLRRRLCNQKIAGSNPASGHLATPFRKEI